MTSELAISNLKALASTVRDVHGGGLELLNRRFGMGVRLRLWLPDMSAVTAVLTEVDRLGLVVRLVAPHLKSISERGEGFQVVIETGVVATPTILHELATPPLPELEG